MRGGSEGVRGRGCEGVRGGCKGVRVRVRGCEGVWEREGVRGCEGVRGRRGSEGEGCEGVRGRECEGKERE